MYQSKLKLVAIVYCQVFSYCIKLTVSVAHNCMYFVVGHPRIVYKLSFSVAHNCGSFALFCMCVHTGTCFSVCILIFLFTGCEKNCVRVGGSGHRGETIHRKNLRRAAGAQRFVCFITSI